MSTQIINEELIIDEEEIIKELSKIEDKRILKKKLFSAFRRKCYKITNYLIKERLIFRNDLIEELIKLGDLDSIKFIIKHGIFNYRTNDDLSMKLAIRYNQTHIVKYFLARGIHANVHKGIFLSIAVANENIELTTLFLNSKNMDIRNRNDFCLRRAFQHKNFQIIRLLQDAYIKKYKDKFVCHSCILLPHCTYPCTKEFVKL